MNKAPDAYVTLDEIVKDVCIEMYATTDTPYYQRFLRFAELGVRELTFDVAREFNETVLVINDLRQADLPAGFVTLMAIGRDVQGQFVPLHTSKRIITELAKDTCGDSVKNPQIDYARTAFSHYHGTQQTGRIYGQGGEDLEGYFHIKQKEGKITFSAPGPVEAGDRVLIRWKGNGVACSGETIIHQYSAMALVEWIHWRRKKENPAFTQAEKDAAERLFYNAKTKARKRIRSFSINDFLQIVRRHNVLTPKV